MFDTILVKCSLAVLAVSLLIVFIVGGIGIGGCGPRQEHTVLIERLYVDTAGGELGGSHYMVVTDAGVFEVDNGLLLGLWNSDELYSSLKEGHMYRITTCGKKRVNALMQYYPYIVSATPVDVSRLTAVSNLPPALCNTRTNAAIVYDAREQRSFILLLPGGRLSYSYD